VQAAWATISSMVAKPKLDELRQAIRARGLRATPSRIAVLELMKASEQPLSHAEVAARLEASGWDPATLYRNLMDFTEVGLARRSDIGDHVWRFELVDGRHDVRAVIELVLPRGKAPRALRQRHVEIHVRGLCDSCGA